MNLYFSFRTLFHLDDGGGPRGANGNAPRTPGRGLVIFDFYYLKTGDLLFTRTLFTVFFLSLFSVEWEE